MKEDVIRMAREVWSDAAILPFDQLERFAALVIANNPPQSSMAWQEGFEAGRLAEREECVRICYEHWLNGGNAMECADAIRERGKA